MKETKTLGIKRYNTRNYGFTRFFIHNISKICGCSKCCRIECGTMSKYDYKVVSVCVYCLRICIVPMM